MESKKQKDELIDTENRLGVARSMGWGIREMDEGDQKVKRREK